ncbi:MAG: noncanonical pyrimidine nucleotidase, YjjG family [Bacteroidales bacterium]|jgi:YjjG family noncanonical pyrimidine nucleotidase|nr:YjjG family noncanonical pyrimidine nucleotidase [Bacteroidales bacterium]NLK80028.1 noncanonical pyrimidine nucleotidase, YjjG family [Bacteroidales bacterium]HKM30877.1 YjjG family noncanonical pyrimidine nucleotidase [Bacteroidales bacterium]HPX79377.1 YjjG family noncanonical pyrimidine nucleotidase [Bacteroidales bacterium]
MKYGFFLFDLDNTLWDFDSNARDCITELISIYNLEEFIPDPHAFYEKYHTNNLALWELYEAGKMSQKILRYKRFEITLEQAGVPGAEKLASLFGDTYLELMPTKTKLMPYAHEVLDYITGKGASIALITNGFKQVQHKKVQSSGLDVFFKNKVFISEEVGYHKPNPRIFTAALTAINGKKKETLMVGDDFRNDIEGAQVFGIDQFYYNPHRVPCDGGPTYMGHDLRDLKDLVQ